MHDVHTTTLLFLYNHPDKEALDKKNQENQELMNQVAQLQAQLQAKMAQQTAATPVASPATPQNNTDKVAEMFNQAMIRMESLEKRLEQQQQTQHVTPAATAAPASKVSKPAPPTPKPDSDHGEGYDEGSEEASEEEDECMVTPDGKVVPWSQFTFHIPCTDLHFNLWDKCRLYIKEINLL